MLRRLRLWAGILLGAATLLLFALWAIVEITGYSESAGARRVYTYSAPQTPTPELAAANSPMIVALAENERLYREQTRNPTPVTPAPTPRPPRDPAEVLLIQARFSRDIDPGESLVYESETQSAITRITPPESPSHYIVLDGTVDVDVWFEGQQAMVTFTAGPGGARVSYVQIVGRTVNSEQGLPDGLPVILTCFNHNLATNDPERVYAVSTAFDAAFDADKAIYGDWDLVRICAAVHAQFPDLAAQHEVEQARVRAERRLQNPPDCGSVDWVEWQFDLSNKLEESTRQADLGNFAAADALMREVQTGTVALLRACE